VKLTFWGTRGSQACPGPDTFRYGGNTSCVEVRADDGSLVILDAGTGIRPLGRALDVTGRRVDVLLSHLHLDHIQGLGFFAPLFTQDAEIHLWGPASSATGLFQRLSRYLSPPLFPVRLRDLPCRLAVHDTPLHDFEVQGFRVRAELVCHPAPTVGYRLEADGGALAYLPDHEPALAVKAWGHDRAWTSGTGLAAETDAVIHDAQYSIAEYPEHVGWGHSADEHAVRFARLAGVRRLIPFHHDPSHDDDELDRMFDRLAMSAPDLDVIPAREGASLELSRRETPVP
jgi:phosphoribosyl 1,2-cyclic phosphodiesterase